LKEDDLVKVFIAKHVTSLAVV